VSRLVSISTLGRRTGLGAQAIAELIGKQRISPTEEFRKNGNRVRLYDPQKIKVHVIVGDLEPFTMTLEDVMNIPQRPKIRLLDAPPEKPTIWWTRLLKA
jgi:hypothetical protein